MFQSAWSVLADRARRSAVQNADRHILYDESCERARFTTDNNRSNLAGDGGYQVYGHSYLADVSITF